MRDDQEDIWSTSCCLGQPAVVHEGSFREHLVNKLSMRDDLEDIWSTSCLLERRHLVNQQLSMRDDQEDIWSTSSCPWGIM